jgi:hypothetical protein
MTNPHRSVLRAYEGAVPRLDARRPSARDHFDGPACEAGAGTLASIYPGSHIAQVITANLGCEEGTGRAES